MRQGRKSSATTSMVTCVSANGLSLDGAAARGVSIHDVSIFAAAGLHRMMAWFSGARRVASILSVFVVIFSVLALQTATHVAKIDNLCAVEVSQVDSEQVAHHPLDGGADPAVLGRVIALMPKPVSAIASIMSDEGAILRPCVLGIPTTGPPASHI